MRQARNEHEAGSMLGSLFDPEDGGDMCLRNIGSFPVDHTALYPRKYNYSNYLHVALVVLFVFIEL
jgi:hypothetical protein